MTGGLFDPLGTGRAEPARRTPRPSAPAVVLCVMLAALALLLVVSWWRDTGDRGMPVAVGPIERLPPAPAAPAPLVEAPPAPPRASPPASVAPPPAGLPPPRDDQDVEIENGVRVVRPRRMSPAPSPAPPSGQGGQTLRVPDAGAAR
ncbi:hypothetical protein [Lichenibacterium dinghuense]|uniref:hypothetical protein n=1 Tax=Lichenibacterium dinghuense TaxID=2895977 RepID=UPI001F26694B|nr:hypothetical protein [Lichenibacterium sp. 6Y81]